jgi:hypothetical protein
LRARLAVKPPRAAPGKGGIVPARDDDDGVSLGTVKLPGNIDIARFESLLFQVSLVRVVLPGFFFRCLLA